jgi:hypothetical protein
MLQNQDFAFDGLVVWLPSQLISGAVSSAQDAVDAAQFER